MTIYVEAVHTVKPLTNTAFDRYVAWYGEHVIPAMKRSGFDILGAWKRTGGAMGQDVFLHRFENMNAYQEAGIALRKDTEFLKAASLRDGAFEITEAVKVGVPVPYVSEERLERALAERPERPRQYVQAQLQVNPGGQVGFYDAVRRLAEATDSGDYQNLVAAFETTIGQRGEMTDIWVMPGGLRSFAYRPGDPLAEIIADLRAVAPEESTYYLNPLPYSPLQ